MSSKNITPSVETATTLPGEYGFISAIVSDLRDDAPKLIYADWLEERGDPCAAFVREFVTAVRSLNYRPKLPASRSYPTVHGQDRERHDRVEVIAVVCRGAGLQPAGG
jgi:uncharacterized protein (TIGR02996 family)